MTKISQDYSINTRNNYAMASKPKTEQKKAPAAGNDDKKEVNLNQSPDAMLGKAMVQLQQAKDSMDEVYETLLSYSSADGMLAGMDYDDAMHAASILHHMQNR